MSGYRDLAQMFLRRYPLQAPQRDSDAERVLTNILAQQYVNGLRRGYDSAISDYYHADEDWDSTTPTLHRILGAMKRWYGR